MQQVTIFKSTLNGSEIVRLPFLYNTEEDKFINLEYCNSSEKGMICERYRVFEVLDDNIKLFPIEVIERVIRVHLLDN